MALYKSWFNKHYGHSEYHILPYSGNDIHNMKVCNSSRDGKYNNDISRHLNKLSVTIQPSTSPTSNEQCGIVLISSLASNPLEQFISCSQQVEVSSVICSSSQEVKTTTSVFEIQRPTPKLLQNNSHHCPNMWTAVADTCISVQPTEKF